MTQADKTSDELMREEGKSKTIVPSGDVTVRIAGKLFRCECSCNVFRHVDGDANKYECNSCGLTYEGA